MKFSLYTSLFTIRSSDPKQNQYVWLFYAFIWSILRNNILTADDTFFIIIDKKTYDYITDIANIKYILNNIPAQIKFICTNSIIETVNQGLISRYNPEYLKIIINKSSSDSIFIYMDVDTIFMKPFRELPWTNKSDVMYVIEDDGLFWDYCHLNAYTPSDSEINFYEILKQNLPPTQRSWGTTMFAFVNNEYILDLFTDIYKNVERSTDKSEYFDQASFIFKLLEYHNSNKINIDPTVFILNKNVLFNNCNNEASIIALLGEAGKGHIHIEKLLTFLFSYIEMLSVSR
jgi:hypothetical protein